MNRGKICRWVVLGASLMIFGIISAYSFWVENHSTMGVRVLSQEQRDAYTQYQYEDLSQTLEFNGELAAVDTGSSTVYLSQDIVAGTKITELPGKLTMNHRDYTLYFAPDSRFEDLAAAVEEDYRFSLLAAKADGTYMEYDVVFTTLPVMRLDRYEAYMDEETRKEISVGNACLWAGRDPSAGRYSVKTSSVQWHPRGGSSQNMEKKPWKLSLKKESQKNNHVDFLGMGADDDWILNPMVVDDSKLKEQLFMGLWNDWAEQASWNYPMSTGEYVELVLNQSYMGVYILQRRVDEKYLQLGAEDILLKGGSSHTPESLEVAYEIQYSPLTAEETFNLMRGVYTGEDTSMVDLDNFVDTNLFLHFGSALDNIRYKNMFYLLEKETNGYRLSLLPWDTDMAWGMTWYEGFKYNYYWSMKSIGIRQEYGSVKQHTPELNTLMAQRWQALRESVFSEVYVFARLDELSAQLRSSGVLNREWTRWEPLSGGSDTEENLRKFLRERLALLDEQFGLDTRN